MKYHPDKNPEGAEKFKEIKEAYDYVLEVNSKYANNSNNIADILTTFGGGFGFGSASNDGIDEILESSSDEDDKSERVRKPKKNAGIAGMMSNPMVGNLLNGFMKEMKEMNGMNGMGINEFNANPTDNDDLFGNFMGVFDETLKVNDPSWVEPHINIPLMTPIPPIKYKIKIGIDDLCKMKKKLIRITRDSMCWECPGVGENALSEEECPKCKNTLIAKETVDLMINLDPGHGKSFVIPGEGNEREGYPARGDVVIQLDVNLPPGIRILDNFRDLEYTHSISFAEFIYGAEITIGIPTRLSPVNVKHSPLNTNIRNNQSLSAKYKLKGLGLSTNGDFYVKFVVSFEKVDFIKNKALIIRAFS